jgi:ketosteroid isomerase-like protein
MVDTFETAQDAEDVFYDALEETDLEKMMSAWSDEEDIICIQPMRNEVRGRTAIRNSWKEIFAANAQLEIEIHHQHWIEMSDAAVHVLHARLIFNGDRTHRLPPLITTNIFRRGEKGWRMVLHHASLPPPPPMPQAPGMKP